MFRYIALSWTRYAREQADAASELDQRLRASPGWKPAYRNGGLHVYVAGDEPGVIRVICTRRSISPRY